MHTLPPANRSAFFRCEAEPGCPPDDAAVAGQAGSPLVTVPLTHWLAGQAAGQPQTDEVAAEVPVALVFNGISHAVMMATPQDLPAFALGFALTEGIIDSVADCRDLTIQSGGSGSVSGDGGDTPGLSVQLDIAPDKFHRLKAHRRTLAGRTGCGVCGIDSLQALDLHPSPVPPAPWRDQLGVDTILRAFAALPAQQPLNARVGSLHAAGWATPEGELVVVREDVGRHNALDKLLGWLAMNGQLGQPGFVVMTSRTSYELVHKCARLGVPVLATISAPTSLALQLARDADVHLWGLCRAPRALRYV